jgi:hypothetical protein
MKTDPEDLAMHQTHRTVQFVGLIFVLLGFGLYGGRAGFGVLCGAVIASVNLFVLTRSVSQLLSGRTNGWAVLAVGKLALLLGLVYLLITSGWIEPFALAVGFGALPLGIVVAGLLGAPLTVTRRN